jgi:hypothetical protein
MFASDVLLLGGTNCEGLHGAFFRKFLLTDGHAQPKSPNSLSL